MELNFKDRMEASGEDLFVVFGVGNAGIDLCLGSDEAQNESLKSNIVFTHFPQFPKRKGSCVQTL
jgi:hypothetical protein